MLKNHLQNIFYPLVILSTFLCVPHISAEEVNSLPNPHPVDEICTLWTIAEWNRVPFPYVEFEQELLSRVDHLSLLKNDLAISEPEIKLLPLEIKALTFECRLFASDEQLRRAYLELEKIRKEILELESQ